MARISAQLSELFVAPSPRGRGLCALAIALLSCTALNAPAFAAAAQSAEPAAADAADETAPDAREIVVTGSLGALPLQGQGTVFGFDKTLAETPRSASSISSQQLERFGITQIYDLVSQVPGTFTSSFFGTAAHSTSAVPRRSLFSRSAAARKPGQLPDADRRGGPH